MKNFQTASIKSRAGPFKHGALCDRTGLTRPVRLALPGTQNEASPPLTINVSTPQGFLHLGRRQGDAHKEQNILQAACVHLALATKDLKVTAEGWGRRGLCEVGTFLVSTTYPIPSDHPPALRLLPPWPGGGEKELTE